MVDIDVDGVGETRAMFQDFSDAFGSEVVYITGTNVEYSIWVEVGTTKMEAQPYLFPAAKAVGRDPEAHIEGYGSIEGLIKQVALAVEREAKERVPVDTGNLKGSIRAQRIA